MSISSSVGAADTEIFHTPSILLVSDDLGSILLSSLEQITSSLRVYFRGTNTNLDPNDRLLFDPGQNPMMFKVKSVEPERVTGGLHGGLGVAGVPDRER